MAPPFQLPNHPRSVAALLLRMQNNPKRMKTGGPSTAPAFTYTAPQNYAVQAYTGDITHYGEGPEHDFFANAPAPVTPGSGGSGGSGGAGGGGSGGGGQNNNPSGIPPDVAAAHPVLADYLNSHGQQFIPFPAGQTVNPWKVPGAGGGGTGTGGGTAGGQTADQAKASALLGVSGAPNPTSGGTPALLAIQPNGQTLAQQQASQKLGVSGAPNPPSGGTPALLQNSGNGQTNAQAAASAKLGIAQQQDFGEHPALNKELATKLGYTGDFGGGNAPFQTWLAQQSPQKQALAAQISQQHYANVASLGYDPAAGGKPPAVASSAAPAQTQPQTNAAAILGLAPKPAVSAARPATAVAARPSTSTLLRRTATTSQGAPRNAAHGGPIRLADGGSPTGVDRFGQWTSDASDGRQSDQGAGLSARDQANADVAVNPSFKNSVAIGSMVAGLAMAPLTGAIMTAGKLAVNAALGNPITDPFSTPGPRVTADQQQAAIDASNAATGPVTNQKAAYMDSIGQSRTVDRGGQIGGAGPDQSAGTGVDTAGHAYASNIGGGGVSHNLAGRGAGASGGGGSHAGDHYGGQGGDMGSGRGDMSGGEGPNKGGLYARGGRINLAQGGVPRFLSLRRFADGGPTGVMPMQDQSVPQQGQPHYQPGPNQPQQPGSPPPPHGTAPLQPQDMARNQAFAAPATPWAPNSAVLGAQQQQTADQSPANQAALANAAAQWQATGGGRGNWDLQKYAAANYSGDPSKFAAWLPQQGADVQAKVAATTMPGHPQTAADQAAYDTREVQRAQSNQERDAFSGPDKMAKQAALAQQMGYTGPAGQFQKWYSQQQRAAQQQVRAAKPPRGPSAYDEYMAWAGPQAQAASTGGLIRGMADGGQVDPAAQAAAQQEQERIAPTPAEYSADSGDAYGAMMLNSAVGPISLLPMRGLAPPHRMADGGSASQFLDASSQSMDAQMPMVRDSTDSSNYLPLLAGLNVFQNDGAYAGAATVGAATALTGGSMQDAMDATRLLYRSGAAQTPRAQVRKFDPSQSTTSAMLDNLGKQAGIANELRAAAIDPTGTMSATNAAKGYSKPTPRTVGKAGGGHMGPGPVAGEGDGQDDKIPALLSDGEYVMDSGVVAMLGNGSNAAGAKKLDMLRQAIRAKAGMKNPKKIIGKQPDVSGLLSRMAGGRV